MIEVCLTLSADYPMTVARNKEALHFLGNIQGPAIERVRPTRVFCGPGGSVRCPNDMGMTVGHYDHTHPPQNVARSLVPVSLAALRDLPAAAERKSR